MLRVNLDVCYCDTVWVRRSNPNEAIYDYVRDTWQPGYQIFTYQNSITSLAILFSKWFICYIPGYGIMWSHSCVGNTKYELHINNGISGFKSMSGEMRSGILQCVTKNWTGHEVNLSSWTPIRSVLYMWMCGKWKKRKKSGLQSYMTSSPINFNSIFSMHFRQIYNKSLGVRNPISSSLINCGIDPFNCLSENKQIPQSCNGREKESTDGRMGRPSSCEGMELSTCYI